MTIHEVLGTYSGACTQPWVHQIRKYVMFKIGGGGVAADIEI